MYIRDLKKDFFDVVVTSRVLVLVNSDVDGVCATKILQYLFKCDHVLYTLVPVHGKKDLFNAFEQNMEGVKYCVLINCGATLPLLDFFEPDDDVVIFVADSHRPVDVTNVYNDGQVRLLMKEDPEEAVPDPDVLFREEESDDEEEWEEDEFGERRRRYDETTLMKQREKREWEAKRNKVLFEYTQYSYYSSSTSLTMYELSWKMSRDTNDLLWWAIVGHTEMFLTDKMDEDRYVLDTANIQNHVARLNSRAEGETMAVDCLKINNDKELNLALYRHWSIYESLRHTAYTATKFKVWTMKGEQRLAEFLAELGLPLLQCKQNFSTMDLELRKDVTNIFLSKAEKYSLNNMTYNSFVSSHGYQHRYGAADLVWAVSAALEYQSAKVDSSHQPFLSALDTLSRSRVDMLEMSTDLAKEQHKLIVHQVQNIIDTRQVVSTGPFLYTVIQEGTPNAEHLRHPAMLTALAQFTLKAHVSVSSSKKTAGLPLVVVAPLDNLTGTCVVIGVPPVSDKTRKNFFGKAFEQAAIKTSCRYLLDYFDSSLIQIKTEDKIKFLDALVSLLT